MTFSILIPTLFKSKRITPLVEHFEKHPLVQEVIVLDNTGGIPGYRDGKLTIIEGCRENYVTKSWNILVDYARSDYYAILNDDILIDPSILDEILEHDWNIPSIIGLDYKNIVTKPQESYPTIRPLPIDETMPYGFGQALFGKKSQWPQIPEYLKIWCNDKYLASKLYPFLLSNIFWEGEIETTSGNPDFDEIKKTDVKRWQIMCEKGLI